MGGEITALWKVLAQQAVGRSYVCQAATPRARPPCSRCFVANASAMGPADQELGGHDRSDTGFGQQRGPSAAWLIKNRIRAAIERDRPQEPSDKRTAHNTSN